MKAIIVQRTWSTLTERSNTWETNMAFANWGFCILSCEDYFEMSDSHDSLLSPSFTGFVLRMKCIILNKQSLQTMSFVLFVCLFFSCVCVLFSQSQALWRGPRVYKKGIKEREPGRVGTTIFADVFLFFVIIHDFYFSRAPSWSEDSGTGRLLDRVNWDYHTCYCVDPV